MIITKFKDFLSEAEFTSQFGHDDAVSFIPMQRQCEELGVARESMEGTIVAVRATKAKIFYDIVDDYHGHLFTNVDSCNVSAQQPK